MCFLFLSAACWQKFISLTSTHLARIPKEEEDEEKEKKRMNEKIGPTQNKIERKRKGERE